MFTQAITALRAARVRSEATQGYRRLLEVDDHLLRDIGVNRNDVRRALRQR